MLHCRSICLLVCDDLCTASIISLNVNQLPSLEIVKHCCTCVTLPNGSGAIAGCQNLLFQYFYPLTNVSNNS